MYSEQMLEVKRRVGYRLKPYKKLALTTDNLPSRVDPSGYVDPNKRIEAAQKAGIRLDELRKAVYDYENPDREIWREEDDDYVNMDIYKDTVDLMEEGFHSLEIYRKRQRALYDDYLRRSRDEGRKEPVQRDQVQSGSAPDQKVVEDSGQGFPTPGGDMSKSTSDGY